MNKSKGQACE